MAELLVERKLVKKLLKIIKKDPKLHQSIHKKMYEIASTKDVEHYKNLRSPMQHLKRVHIQDSFVLLFTQKDNQIIFVDIDHHENAYD